jgi:NTE family protein
VGALNNVPLDALVERGYKDIIVLRIFGVGREKPVEIPEHTTVYSIEPRVNLGNMLEFDAKKSKRNMIIGYYDAMRLLYGLAGIIYYIEEKEEECYYFKQLIEIQEEAMLAFMKHYGIHSEGDVSIRNMTEKVLPAIASELKLPRGWTYKTLYLAVLEGTAKLCRVSKYHIYTLEELRGITKERLEKLDGMYIRAMPVFIHFFRPFESTFNKKEEQNEFKRT